MTEDNRIVEEAAELEDEVLKSASDVYGNVAENFVRAYNDMQRAVHEWAKSKGWWDVELDPSRRRNDAEMIALQHSELSEALEGIRGEDAFPEFPKMGQASDKIGRFLAIEEEYADTIIRNMDHSEARGLRVALALIAKMLYNEQRSYRHGGKRY